MYCSAIEGVYVVRGAWRAAGDEVFKVMSGGVEPVMSVELKKLYLAMCKDEKSSVRLFLTSDLHSTTLSDLDPKDADIVVVSGDFMGGGMHSDEAGAAFLIDRFFPWCRKYSDKDIVLTAGNHDKFLYRMWEDRAKIKWPDNVHYLIDQKKTIRGLKFYGTPWCTNDREGRFELDGKTLEYVFDKIPSGLDVLISHTPPKINGSDIDYSDWAGIHEGSKELTAAIKRAKPRIVVCGHVHSGSHKPVKIGSTKVMNVARVKDKRDEAAFDPVVVDISIDDKD